MMPRRLFVEPWKRNSEDIDSVWVLVIISPGPFGAEMLQVSLFRRLPTITLFKDSLDIVSSKKSLQRRRRRIYLLTISNGDLRRAIGLFQSAARLASTTTEETTISAATLREIAGVVPGRTIENPP